MSTLTKHLVQLVGIAKSWAGKNLAGWSEESHRDLLARHGATQRDGRVSSLTMSVAQLNNVLDDYERRGWPRERREFNGGQTKRTVSPQIAHMVRLWGKLGTAGKVDNATRPALLSFCGRQVGHEVRDLDSLADADRQNIIEALKGWLGRE